VEWVVRRFARQLVRLLERRGLGPHADPSEADLFSEDEPLLAALYSALVRGRIATGRRAGQRVLRLGDRIDSEDIDPAGQERCVNVAGVSLHANVYVPARDRKRLERLCRYAARPPVATKRLSRLPDGRLLYRLKHRWRDGSTHMVYEPMELLERLAALMPPPRAHQVRYHGILGPTGIALHQVHVRCPPLPQAEKQQCPRQHARLLTVCPPLPLRSTLRPRLPGFSDETAAPHAS
jgi:hypothetical protein